jgi:flagellar biosynthesis GTPase FlhF
LDQGSALIEVVQKTKGNRITIRFSASVVEIQKNGLYRFDAGAWEIRVYGGEALVSAGGKKIAIKNGKMMRVSDDFSSASFNVNAADSLHQWAAERSFHLFVSNPKLREQSNWVPISLGWLHNFDYRMSFRSELVFAELERANRNKESRERRMTADQEGQWPAQEGLAAEEQARQAVEEQERHAEEDQATQVAEERAKKAAEKAKQARKSPDPSPQLAK